MYTITMLYKQTTMRQSVNTRTNSKMLDTGIVDIVWKRSRDGQRRDKEKGEEINKEWEEMEREREIQRDRDR